ncbi:uncharacterized protein LACBIDRAFT_329355 [Laccaria bicolor S238N-H82]|uniref:Predicted protein n=1 Tax=Laccaria bicolor (strain S238N-H82 / ATCC MYA-4686) TaxID=486041 RepID=B0DHS7_LACBS|nr:uncharacterized protein LACBIDRAFT_329355 [Laccaria bicolor S238N-H82]EDR05781.1 predicted protein [Laccaria bicolor S238N-H82]|eukprot:XP_001883457.1 predicted protein [Laccaria bicolor S238N-H82]
MRNHEERHIVTSLHECRAKRLASISKPRHLHEVDPKTTMCGANIPLPSSRSHEHPYVLGASESLQKNDIVIACVLWLVVATTGIGKTTFINNFARALLLLDNSLQGSNAGVQAVVIPGVGRRHLILVEIPGCGSIARGNDQIEILVKEWLTSKQFASTQFLHNYIRKHCKDMCKHLVLATTSCDKGHEDMMVSGSWKPLIDKGATVFRLDNTAASALELAITLLAKDQSVSDAEHLNLGRRQAKWHGTGTALTCLPVYPVRFIGLIGEQQPTAKFSTPPYFPITKDLIKKWLIVSTARIYFNTTLISYFKPSKPLYKILS